jgi:uncharacterized protein YcbK (DUF882 family)
MNWEQFKNFSENEFRCKCGCGKALMQQGFMEKLQELRTAYGKPMVISSGYRCPKHPVEAKKSAPGTHSEGLACDVAVLGADAHQLLKLAMAMGFTGIGVNQKGAGRFLHLDTRQGAMVWSY